MDTLAPLRDKIDALDQQILQLLNERAGHVIEVGRVKRKTNQEIVVLSREEEIMNKVLDTHQGPLPKEAVEKIFMEIILHMRALQY